MTDGDTPGFCVPYSVGDSPGKGRGVFAAAPTPKDSIIWRFVRGNYSVYDERSFHEYLAKLSRSDVIYELEHMFGAPEFPGYVIRVFDDGVLINHSREPNVAVYGDFVGAEIPYDTSAKNARDVEAALLNDRFALVAIEDVQVGEEFTHDYNFGVEDPPYFDALYDQYGLTEPWL